MYGRRKHQLRRLEHTRAQHQLREQRRHQTLRHEMQMHLARVAR